jgi:YHS domain-containing protein
MQIKTLKSSNKAIKCAVRRYTLIDKVTARIDGLMRSYKGKKYYFCCDLCLLEFDKNPKQFAH